MKKTSLTSSQKKIYIVRHRLEAIIKKLSDNDILFLKEIKNHYWNYDVLDIFVNERLSPFRKKS
mgnify:CR=1 FL=1